MYQTLRDWKVQLQHTYVFLPNKGEVGVMLVSNVRSPRGKCLDELQNPHKKYSLDSLTIDGTVIYKKKDNTLVREDTSINNTPVYIDMPYLGMANLNEYVVYITYNVVRQWKKSLTKAVTSVVSPVRMEMRYMGRRGPVALCLEAVYNIMNKEYYGLNEAAELIYKGERLGCALCRHFCLVTKVNVRYPVLVYKTTAVGYVKDGVVRIPKEFNYLHEELGEIKDMQKENVIYE